MTSPYLSIDLEKIEHNARTVVSFCAAHGMTVTGVTKGVCGHPGVAGAMLRGGVCAIGDSRLENIARLRAAGLRCPFVMIRLPPLSAADQIVEAVALSLNSELAVLEALSQAARRRGRRHDVVLMVDLGDLREGILPDDLVPFVREALRLPGIRIAGLGTNLACFGGVVPSSDNMRQFLQLAREIETTFCMKLDQVSGANSSHYELIASGHAPPGINNARIGEGILLGRETVHRGPWPGTVQDAFILHAEVLELKQKPSVPVGQRGEDAYGETPHFVDAGNGERAILNVGREDIYLPGIAPLDSHLSIIGASSGYLIVDATAARGNISVGDRLAFSLSYSALTAAMTSEYVKKIEIGPGAGHSGPTDVSHGDPGEERPT
ncbi:MAG: alanine/ornithine racemase family PLP-dependent enzyme [Gammaproteobacteria bacterium]|nr:alanine/ornithine racemase family PLP-dependent enzyme [Gammaproteobacteria bacterium]